MIHCNYKMLVFNSYTDKAGLFSGLGPCVKKGLLRLYKKGNARKLIIMAAVMALVGCGKHTQAWKQMDTADSLMNTKPDSALAILENIPASNITGKETSARYALLKSMALDKNYIDTTTFDVLQPAIDYYLNNGTPDEQLRTYYYQGRIYQNQGNKDLAMQSFMRGKEFCDQSSDTMTTANLMVAQASIFYSTYKIDDFIKNNLEAVKLYMAIDRIDYEILSLANVLDGSILNNNKILADSIMSIAQKQTKQHPELRSAIAPYILSYVVKFGNKEEITEVLNYYASLDTIDDVTKMDVAEAYLKIGDPYNAKRFFESISTTSNARKSLKYLAIKPDILEQNGDFAGALAAYRNFSITIDSIHQNIFSHDLLFAQERHEMEKSNLIKMHRKNNIILGSMCGIFGLAILVGWLFYRGHLSKAKRILTEKENKNLKLEQDNLRKEKEKAELERDKKALEAANLKLEIAQLESERDHLKELQKEQSELAKPIQDVIKTRLDMLNGLLAKEITNNESYAKPYNKWIETVHNDKKKFMNSTRLALAASNPKFMEYLEQHGLSTDEINYLCLYAIGLRGKEVGEYIQLKRHYIISSEIRKKLGINEHETNIGLYIRRLMKDS